MIHGISFKISRSVSTRISGANKGLQLSDNIKEKIAMYRVGLPVNPPFVDEQAYQSENPVDCRRKVNFEVANAS